MNITLIPNSQPLYHFLESSGKNIVDVGSIPSKSTEKVKIFVKFLGMSSAIFARASMVNVCLTAGSNITNKSIDDSQALAIGITNSIGSVLGSGLISLITVNSLIDEIFKKHTELEIELFSINQRRCKERFLVLASIIGGIAAQFPVALGSYYGTVDPIPPLFAFCSQISDFSRPAYSIYNHLKEISIASTLCQSENTKKLLAIRENLANSIELIAKFISADPEKYENIISIIDELSKENINGNEFLISLLKDFNIESKPNQYFLLEFASKFFAFILLSSYFLIAYEGSKALFLKDPFAPIVLGSLTALANMNIFNRLTKNGISHVINVMKNKTDQPLLKKSNPNLYNALTFLGILISLMPWAPSIYFANQYYPSEIKDAGGILSAIGICLCSVAATSIFRNYIIEKNNSDRDLQVQIQTQKFLLNVSKTTRKTSLLHIEAVYLSLPAEIQTKLNPRAIVS